MWHADLLAGYAVYDPASLFLVPSEASRMHWGGELCFYQWLRASSVLVHRRLHDNP